MNFEDIKPNTIESIIFFVLYICAQDKVISESEKSFLIKISKYELINEFKLFKLNKADLESTIHKMSKSIIKSNFLHKYTSKEEKALIDMLINDTDVIKVALRIARVAASADEFSDREKIKFEYWINNWKSIILDGN